MFSERFSEDCGSNALTGAGLFREKMRRGKSRSDALITMNSVRVSCFIMRLPECELLFLSLCVERFVVPVNVL